MRASFAFIIALILSVAAHAAVPPVLSYQGYLTDSSGAPVTGGVTISLSIYNVESGGSPLWTDDQSLVAEQGLFSVALGSPLNPLPPNIFDAPLFIEIDVNDDGPMMPRRALTSVAFSIESDNASTLQGQSPAALDQSDHVADLGNPHGVTAMQIGAASTGQLATLQAQLDAAVASIATLQSELAAANSAIAALQSGLASEVANRIADVDAEEVARIAADIAQDDAILALQANTVLTLDGLLTLDNADTALFTGVNVQVVNGTGASDSQSNGLGNVIVGYNEIDELDPPICSVSDALNRIFDNQLDCEDRGGTWASSHKSGSHNVVIGDRHNYAGNGGLVVGANSNILGSGTSVVGGENNTALRTYSSVSGGRDNIAVATWSSISGGTFNTTTGNFASISGGQNNRAEEQSAAVSGGALNVADGIAASVSGGYVNTSSNFTSQVSGGRDNTASGAYAMVSGGRHNTASGDSAGIVGGGGQVAGDGNVAFSNYSVVVGGRVNTTGDSTDPENGQRAIVIGGQENVAAGDRSAILGGQFNETTGPFSTVSGGNLNIAIGANASVSGGSSGTASGTGSSISGGNNNTASEPRSSVAGGDDLTCSSSQAVCAEGAFSTAD